MSAGVVGAFAAVLATAVAASRRGAAATAAEREAVEEGKAAAMMAWEATGIRV